MWTNEGTACQGSPSSVPANPRGLRALSRCVAERDMEASAPPRPRGALRSPDRLRTSGDAELVRLVRLGHEPAFEQIYDRHHRGILSFCRHMLGSRDEAEDALQHTFIAAYRDLRGSDKPIHLKAWLYTIARNRCLSMLRARREQVAIEDFEPSTDGLAAQVQQRQDLRDMLRDLQRLPDDQREALVLSELGALSHEEIAMTLGVRKEKIKALVFQARESLASSREARNADCREIQQQLSVLRGGSLRRTQLRRHLEGCPSCQAFKDEVQRQRAAMAIILPVVPSAGLKSGVLGAAASAGAGALGAGVAGGGAVVAGGGIGAKLFVGAVLMGGAVGGGILAVDGLHSPPPSAADERNGAQARILGFDGAGRTDKAGRPADGDARAVVGTLRERAGAVARQRSAQRARTTTWGTAGDKTSDAVVTLVAGALDGLGGATTQAAPELSEARKAKKAREERAKPKKAKKPKVSQGYGAQGKGNAYGRGREPAAGNGQGTPGGASKPARPAGPKQAGSAPARPNGGNGSRPPKPNGKARKPAGPGTKQSPPAPAPAHATPGASGKGKGKGNANGHEKRNGASADPAAVTDGIVGAAKDVGSAAAPRNAEAGEQEENAKKRAAVEEPVAEQAVVQQAAAAALFGFA